MKLILSICVLMCAYAQASKVDEVFSDLTIKDLHLNMLTPQYAFTDHDQTLFNEILAMDANVRNTIANTIKDMLEGFRDTVVNGNENIPPLDPFMMAEIGPFDVEIMTGTRATFGINNFHMDGLRWYVVDYVNFNAFRLTMGLHITVPWLTFTGSYDAQARLGPLIVHRAGGNYRIFVNRLEIGADLRLGTNLLGGHLILRELDIKIDIQDVNIRVEGMVGSSLINNFINNLVQSVTQDVVHNQMENLSKMISEGLFDTVNDILKDYTLADILG